jgi:GTP-binding protein
VVDTGGFEPDSTTGIVKEMARQTRQAVAEADAVIFVVDAAACRRRTTTLRATCARQQEGRAGCNKAEGMIERRSWPSFTNWASVRRIPVSAAHGQGIRSLLEAALEGFSLETKRTWRSGPTRRSAWPWPAGPTSASPP